METIRCADGAEIVAVRKRPTHQPHGAVVCFHGFSQNRYSFHLPDFSLTTWLVAQGWETWNVDLRGHGRSRPPSPVPLSADDYIRYDVPAALYAVQARSGMRPFALGHSLGGGILYAGTTAAPDAVAGVIAMSAVYGFGGRQPLFRLAGHALRPLPSGGRIDAIHLPIDWVGHGVAAVLGVIDHPGVGVSPITIWHPRTMHRTRLAFRVTDGFDRTSVGVLRHLLRWAAERRFLSYDRSVDYAARWRAYGTMPLLCIAGDRDTLLPPSDAKLGYRDSPARDKTFRVFGRSEGGQHWGHVDVVQGDRAPLYVWPAIRDWLDARRERGRPAAN